jgi:hypothetical protein
MAGFGYEAVKGATYSFTVPPHLRYYMLHPKTPQGGAKVTETRDTELQQKYNNTQTFKYDAIKKYIEYGTLEGFSSLRNTQK